MTEVETSARRPNAYTSRRTEAMPKTSLFGSSLEIQDEESAKKIRELDVANLQVPQTPPVKGTGQRFTLPEDVKRGLPGAHVLAKSKQDLATTKNQLNSTRTSLQKKEEQVLYSFPSAGQQGAGPGQPDSSRSQWFTENDLRGSQEINILGLNKNQSFNRDRYGRRPPIHNYSLIGDVLRPGMDSLRRERTDIQMRNLGYGKGDLRGSLAEVTKPPQRVQKSPDPKPAVIEIPPNIKHQYGSRVCDKLLSDQATVEQTMKDQERLKSSIQKKSKPFHVPKFNKEMNPEYEMLGNALRMNVVPGYTMNQNVTTTKTAFNDQVHLFRNQDPDKYRYQKDELSKWNEETFLYKRMLDSWDDWLNSAPKFKRDWNVQSQAPVVKSAPQPTKRTRPRAPAKPKTAAKDTKESKEPAFEDFVFETPPQTPPPEKVAIKKTGNTRDSEFWNFYDKKDAQK